MEKHSLACQLNKQFIHRNLFLYDVAMFVLLQSERSNQCEEKRFGCFRLFCEDTQFLQQLLLIFLADFEFALVEFHLTDIDSSISTVYQHIRKYSIPTRQIGNFVYVPKKEIDNLYKGAKQ